MSHRYRMYPTQAQATMMERHCGDARFVWNLALEQANLWRRHWGPTPNRSERAVGVDRGVAVSAATSDGEMLSCPTPKATEKARRLRLQRRLAHHRKGSNRRDRTKRSLARMAARQADRRKDWVEKVSTDLVRRYDLIAFEDLGVQRMMRSASGTIESPGVNVAQKRGLNRSIAEQGWGMLARRTQDKAEASNVEFVKVPPAGTSQTCAQCQHRCPENRESQAVFRCQQCGHEANADTNAALNILAAGLAVTARGGTEVARADEPRTTKERSYAA